MHDAEVDAVLARAVDNLEEAAGISRRDGVDTCGFDALNFPVEQIIRHFRLNNVVNAGTAAAPSALGEFDEVQAGDGF